MPIIEVVVQQAGLIGVAPKWVYIATNDTIAEVTTPGYLNQTVQAGYSFNETDMALVSTKTSPSAAQVDVSVLNITYSNGNWSLESASDPGSVTLPTITNHIIVSTNTTGGLGNLSGTAINNGSIQAGLSGTQGTLISYPATAASGSLKLSAVAIAGNYVATISNSDIGQATTYSMPDAGNAAAQFLVGPGAAPFVDGNIPIASGTDGLMVDSGIAIADIPTVTLPTVANNIIVATNTTGNLANEVATAINPGSLQAGVSGVAGALISYPTTATNGNLTVAAVDAGANFVTTISNSTMGQSTVYSIPDAGNAVGKFLVAAGATPFVDGNLPVASGTAGLMVDSGNSISDFLVTTGTTTMASGSYLQLDLGTGTVVADTVDINHQVMYVTTGDLTTAQYATYSFTITNSLSTAGRGALATVDSVAGTNTINGITVEVNAGAGELGVQLTNLNSSALNGTVVLTVVLL